MRHANTLLEDHWRVVCYKVDATQLLHELTANAEEGAATEALGTFLEKSQESDVSGCRTFFLECVCDLGHLGIDDWIVVGDRCTILLQSAKNDTGFVGTVVSDKLCSSLVYLCTGTMEQGNVLTQRGDSGKIARRAMVTSANKICNAIGNLNWASLLTKLIP